MLVSVALAPNPNQSIVCTSGAVYQADQNGIIVNIASIADQNDLAAAGCAILVPNATDLLFSKIGVNFNTTADQLLTPKIVGKFRVRRITFCNTSANGMATAAGGIYSAAAKATGQGVIVAAGQVYTGLTNAATALDLTLALPNLILDANTSLYFALTTGHGSPATADAYVYGDVIQ